MNTSEWLDTLLGWGKGATVKPKNPMQTNRVADDEKPAAKRRAMQRKEFDDTIKWAGKKWNELLRG